MKTRLRQVNSILFAVFLLILSGKAFAQTPSSEADLKKEAAKYFDDDDFTHAYPLYSQLLSLYQQDPDYNFRFGACMLFFKEDKAKPIDYLEFAIKKPNIDNLAYYYLGRAYHLNYRFDDAIKAYTHFQQHASSSELKKHPVDHLIQQCGDGKTLLKDVHDLDVLVKKELSVADYFHAYDLSANGGTTLVEPDDFKTKLDKKKQVNSVIYLSPDRSEVFFSSYGDNDQNGKDIYKVKRLPTGGFSKPENLGTIINTPYDEDFPFYDAPTHTLYFSSKGHNSMGGYDVFKSVYNENFGTWSTPVNMDFPINTPDDDILFIADTVGQTAYFASTRSSPGGTIDIYKIRIQHHAPENVLIQGVAYTDNGKTPTSATITVKDFQTGKTVDVFNAARDSGTYFMNLPNNRQLVYTVETPGHAIQSASVLVPKEDKLVAVKQEIGYEEPTDKLVVTNHFEMENYNQDYLLALEYIRRKSKMDVNVDSNAPAPTVTPVVASNQNATQQPANNTTTGSSLNGTNATLPANNTSGSVGSATMTGTTAAGNSLTSSNAANTSVNNNASAVNTNNQTASINNANPSTGSNANPVSADNVIQTNNSPVGNNTDSNRASSTAQVANSNKTSSAQNTNAAGTNTASQNNGGDTLNPNGNISSAQLVNVAQQDAQQDQQAAQASKDEADRATEYASDKLAESQSLNNQAREITENANSITDPKQKSDSLAKAGQLKQQATEASKKAIEAFQVAAQEQADAQVKQKQADASGQYSHNLDSLTQVKNNKQAIGNLMAQQESLKKQQQQSQSAPIAAVTAGDLIRNEAQNTKQDSTHLAQHNEELKQEQGGLQQQSEDYISKAQKTDNPQEKIALLQQAKDLSESKKNKQKEIENNKKLQQQLHEQYVSQLSEAKSADSLSKSNPEESSQQVSATDAASIKQDIQNYTPSASSIALATSVAKENAAAAGTNGVSASAAVASTTSASSQLLASTSAPGNTNSATSQTGTSAIQNNSTGNTQTNSNNSNTVTSSQTIQNTTDQNNSAATQVGTTNTDNSSAQSGQNANGTNTSNSTSTSQVVSNSNNSTNTQSAQQGNSNSASTPPGTTQQLASTTTQNSATVGLTSTNHGADSSSQSGNVAQAQTTTPPVDPATVVNYSVSAATQASANAALYSAQADSISDQATDTRARISKTKDVGQARMLSQQADSLDNLAQQKKIESAAASNTANATQFIANKHKINTWQNTLHTSNSDEVETAHLLVQDANLYFNKSLDEKLKADSTDKGYLKQNYLSDASTDLSNALLKQQAAEKAYLTANPKLASVKVANTPITADELNAPQTDLAQRDNFIAQRRAAQAAITDSTNAAQANTNGQTTNTAQSNSSTVASANGQVAQNANTANNTVASTINQANPNQANVNNTNATNNSVAPNSNIAQNATNNSSLISAGAVNNNQVAQNSSSNNPVPNSNNTASAGNANQAGNSEVITPASITDASTTTTTLFATTGNANQASQTNVGNTNSANNSAQNNSASTSAQNNAANNSTSISTTSLTVGSASTASSQNASVQSASKIDSILSSTGSTFSSATQNQVNSATNTSQNNSGAAVDLNTANNNASSTGQNNSSTTTTQNSATVQNSTITSQANNNSTPNNTGIGDNAANSINQNSTATGNNNGINSNSIQNPANTSSTVANSTTANSDQNNSANNNSSATSPANTNVGNTSITNTNPSTIAVQSAAKIDSILSSNNTGTTAPPNSNAISSNNNAIASNNNSPVNNVATTIPDNHANTQQTQTSSTSLENTNQENVTVSTAKPITKDVFVTAQTSPYSAKKPIPINPPLPEGLVFKVQIGAFRNPIPQNLFKGIQPVTGERTPAGLTRYTAGVFKELTGAQNAQNKIHELGYKDAFVVAFYNGKRISLPEAEAMLNGKAPETTAPVVVAQNTPAPVNTTAQEEPQTNTNTANTTPVNKVQGLFFSVQVGAYQHPVTAAKLYNLSPLFSYNTTNGYIRYNCGIYSSISSASAAKQQIRAKGIQDAFIVAYLNGERIDLAKAAQLMAGGSAVVSQDANLNVMPNGTHGTTEPITPVQPATNNTTPLTTTPANTNTTSTPAPVQPTTDNTTPVNTIPANTNTASTPAPVQPATDNTTPLTTTPANTNTTSTPAPVQPATDNTTPLTTTPANTNTTSTPTPVQPATDNNAPVNNAHVSTNMETTLPAPADNTTPVTTPAPVQPTVDNTAANNPVPNTTTTIPAPVTNTETTLPAPAQTFPASPVAESSMGSRSFSSSTVDPASDVTVSVTIHRGNISGFAKLREDIPSGFTASQGDSKGANFKFADGRLGYVWLALPSDSVFTVTYKVTALSTATGPQTFTGKFFYTVNDEKQEISIPATILTVNGPSNPGTGNTIAASTSAIQTDTSKVSFCVQVGEFTGPIPIDMANKLLQISNQGIKAHKEDNGINTYTVGDYSNYTSADLLKQELVKDGYPAAFVVAYYQGKKISLQQAQLLMNK